MSKYDREYEAFQIFEQVQDEKEAEVSRPRKDEETKELSPKKSREWEPVEMDDSFYEIEYDSCPLPGVGKFVLRSQKLEAPVRDPVRERFDRMRDIARKNQYLYYENSRFYDQKIRQENSRIFYEQGRFMEEFEDHYEKEVPFSAYFPSYQAMGYDQLRTYFTWRTKVRQGEIEDTSISYIFLYLYELLNQIGVRDEEEGADKLLELWLVMRQRQGAIGKYVLRWLKDYHIYYELPWSFKEFIDRNGLEAYYPELTDPEDNFELLCSISKYDVRKSVFYKEGQEKLIRDCFQFTLRRLKQVFEDKGIDLEAMIFQPAKNMPQWTPFKEALFCPVRRQRDRRVVLSEKEIYLCSGNNWTFSTRLTTESGKRLVGYIMKQMESVLRKALHYKYKLSSGSLSGPEEEVLRQAGIDLEAEVKAATLEFYRESTKTVVSVDPDRLRQIRQEALQTQERLLVPEEEAAGGFERQPELKKPGAELPPEMQEKPGEASDVETERESGLEDPWTELKNALTEVERQALGILWRGGSDIRQFADSHGIMLEVLAEGINEKAMDHVGDGLLDGELAVYEDYAEQIEEILS